MKPDDKYRASAADGVASAADLALVTGAAGGIGFAFADRLGALGYNLALADIDGERLGAAAADLQARHGVNVRILQVDLSQPTAAWQLHDWCARENIAPLILINNAGIFSYNDIVNTATTRIETMAGLHVVTVSLLCRLFAADMAGRPAMSPAAPKGYILNMSSYSTWMPWPGLAMYSATKSYIRNFSLSLAAELRDRNVTVTTVLPAGVTTGLYGLSPKWQRIGHNLGILMTPERTAELALAAMFRGRRQYVPGLLMRLVLPIVRTLPACVIRIARRKTLKFQK